MERTLGLIGVGNARQLGGYEIKDKKIKQNRLLRTASLSAILPEDIDILNNTYKVAAVVDLRMSVERDKNPDPKIPGAKNLILPVMEITDFPGSTDETAEYLSDPTEDRFEMLKRSYEMGLFSDRFYEEFLFNERGKAAYRGFFKCLLELPQEKSVLWHCTDGKDRTGVASMLILSALGATKETIINDYMATNDYNAERIKAASEGLEQAALSPELEEIALFGAGAVYEKYIVNAMNGLDERYGSVAGYLKQELGVGKDECAELRHSFLEEIEIYGNNRSR
ncbi:MAG: tyrosine-protein phosphatase [Lachnospiraceae bacterium]|nr:tyrosine-protein phosphatase [Lachnospiraceae bacterium]